jgi:hypothetical protein
MQAGSWKYRQRKRRVLQKGAPFFFGQQVGGLGRAQVTHRQGRVNAPKKIPATFAGQTIRVQRIGAFGQSNRVSGNGTTLLLTITPAQRVCCAGVMGSGERATRRAAS